MTAEVRIRLTDRSRRMVSVQDPACPTFACFQPARHMRHARGIGAIATSRWECAHREQMGCPEVPAVAAPPRWRTVRGTWEEATP